MIKEFQAIGTKNEKELNELKERIKAKESIIQMYDKKFEELEEEVLKFKDKANTYEKQINFEIQKAKDDMIAGFQKKESDFLEIISEKDKVLNKVIIQNKEIINSKQLNEKSIGIIKKQLELAVSELKKLKKSKKLPSISKEIQVTKKDLLSYTLKKVQNTGYHKNSDFKDKFSHLEEIEKITKYNSQLIQEIDALKLKVDKSVFSIIELNEKLYQCEEKKIKVENEYKLLNIQYEELLKKINPENELNIHLINNIGTEKNSNLAEKNSPPIPRNIISNRKIFDQSSLEIISKEIDFVYKQIIPILFNENVYIHMKSQSILIENKLNLINSTIKELIDDFHNNEAKDNEVSFNLINSHFDQKSEINSILKIKTPPDNDNQKENFTKSKNRAITSREVMPGCLLISRPVLGHNAKKNTVVISRTITKTEYNN